ncbi:MAG: chemotaxis protein MotB [Planctomycetota bacterium]
MPAEPTQKEGAPAWMVSFGDMMTLILTFFILLVSMSQEQKVGLLAKGVGSFMVSVRSFGLPGILDKKEEAAIFEEVRSRFNLPPEEDPSRRTDYVDASNLELVRATAAKALNPHDELSQPSVAVFEIDSADLQPAAERYLDMIAQTLRPSVDSILVIEGHSSDAGSAHSSNDRWLAFRRARAVADYLIEEHGYPEARVQARAWVSEISSPGFSLNGVDARLIKPNRPKNN